MEPRHVSRVVFAVVCAMLLAAVPPAWSAPVNLSTAPDRKIWEGAWQGADRASQARYGVLRIGETEVQWRGASARSVCRVRYSAQRRAEQEGYPDRLAVPGVAVSADEGRRYWVMALRLAPAQCLGERSALQLAVPVDDQDQGELVTYDRSGRPVGWGRFQRTSVRRR